MRTIQLIIITFLLILVTNSFAAGQEPKGLNDLVRLNVRKVRVGDVLARTAVQSEISIGFDGPTWMDRTQL